MTPAEIVSGAFRGLELAGLLGVVGVVGHRQLGGPTAALPWARPALGGVLVLATLQPPDGWRSLQGQDLLTRFGRVAMVAFAFTALTGLLRATEELTGFGDLWQTAYGTVLVAKSVGVLAMLALAAVTWRRGVPVARTDAVMALAVMVATGLLAAFPNPP